MASAIKSIPKDVLREYEKVYPFGWLGVLSRTKTGVSRVDLFTHRPRFCALFAAFAGVEPLLPGRR